MTETAETPKTKTYRLFTDPSREVELPVTYAPFNRIVHSATENIWRPAGYGHYEGFRKYKVFTNVKWDGFRLSITSVSGPAGSDCVGSAGAWCPNPKETVRDRSAEGSVELPRFLLVPVVDLARLHEIAAKYHLNELTSCCVHQESWDFEKLLSLYYWRLKAEASKQQRQLHDRMNVSLKAGETVTPTEEEQRLLKLEYSFTTTTPDAPNEAYEPAKALYPGDRKPTEIKTARGLRPSEHPEGLLTKACPTCGYRYGSAWLYRPVPTEVLDFLSSLPDNAAECPSWWRD